VRLLRCAAASERAAAAAAVGEASLEELKAALAAAVAAEDFKVRELAGRGGHAH